MLINYGSDYRCQNYCRCTEASHAHARSCRGGTLLKHALYRSSGARSGDSPNDVVSGAAPSGSWSHDQRRVFSSVPPRQIGGACDASVQRQ